MARLAVCAACACLIASAPAGAQDASVTAPTAVANAPAAGDAVPAPAARAQEVLGVSYPASAPPDLTAPPAPVAPPPPPPPAITLELRTDLSAQRLTVIENGVARHVWPISSGRAGYATKTGIFTPQWASRMWYSRQYEYAPMPHAIFFHRGTAFHGTGATGMLGRPASHGCVRLAPAHAKLLFNIVHKHGFVHTKVVVHGGPRRGAPAVAQGTVGNQVAARKRTGRSAMRSGYPGGW
jgi:lipoprotein-anchoring transpeptidase ErfK/SrfK